MNIDAHLHLVPKIEALIRALRPDALVCGMGPTAWLLPWIDQSLLRGVRLFGAHDGCRIMPLDDVVIMDGPANELSPDTSRYEWILKSRPKRFWVYKHIWPKWMAHLHPSVHPICNQLDLGVWPAPMDRVQIAKAKFKLETTPIQTHAISPTGTTTLAWREGARRIGVIGVDMRPGFHRSAKSSAAVDKFFRTCAQHAKDRGGVIWNLSPISNLKDFVTWTVSESSLAQTPGLATPVQSESLSTASASMPPAQ